MGGIQLRRRFWEVGINHHPIYYADLDNNLLVIYTDLDEI
jgi:hypothetical protein